MASDEVPRPYLSKFALSTVITAIAIVICYNAMRAWGVLA